ncbi:MAG: J domain-containing protein [Clostridiales bacterium]|nr:J domain-containing protein [Clostridiales bacterium]
MNPYEILNVPVDASRSDIKEAFARLSEEAFIEMSKDDPTSIDRYKRVCEAYEILSDPQSRREYDQDPDAGGDKGPIDDRDEPSCETCEDQTHNVDPDTSDDDKKAKNIIIRNLFTGIGFLVVGGYFLLEYFKSKESTFSLMIGLGVLAYGGWNIFVAVKTFWETKQKEKNQ